MRARRPPRVHRIVRSLTQANGELCKPRFGSDMVAAAHRYRHGVGIGDTASWLDPDPGSPSSLRDGRRRCQSTSRPASHLLVYALMFAAAAGRWTILSAGEYPSHWSAACIYPRLSASIQRCSRCCVGLAPSLAYPLPNHPDAFRRRPVPRLGQARCRIPKHGVLTLGGANGAASRRQSA